MRVLIGNFKGPKGDKGEQGATGPKGEQGIQGPVGPAGGVDSVNGAQGDVVIDGRNLLLHSGEGIASSAKTVAIWDMSESGVIDEIYTFSAFLTPASNVTRLSLYRNNGSGMITSNIQVVPGVRQIIHHTFVNTENTYADLERPALWVEGSIDVYSETVIHWAKLERGNVATGWSPAPEDYLGPFNAYNITNMHRNIFRGQSLGSTFTDAQKAAIAAGTWDDLYLGDYWTINNHTWRIADFDYWLGKGDTSCAKHHVVVVPDVPLYSAQMHNTDTGEYVEGVEANTTVGGYYNSDMRTTNLARAKTIIETDFGPGSILNHRILLTNTVKDGYPSAGIWYDSEVDLMNEMMVYGAFHFAPRGNGTIIPYNYTTEYTQLALFQLAPYYIRPVQYTYWLRDVVSTAYFAVMYDRGYPSYSYASDPRWVRPAVGIVGE